MGLKDLCGPRVEIPSRRESGSDHSRRTRRYSRRTFLAMWFLSSTNDFRFADDKSLGFAPRLVVTIPKSRPELRWIDERIAS
jgi:hypothetical protein